jgi:hypothetical protein
LGFVPDDKLIGRPFLIYWSKDMNKNISNVSDFFKSIRLNRVFTTVH